MFVFAQVHAYIISSLKKEMPSVFGKDSKKKELIANLPEIYATIEREHQISPGDFPNVKKMQVQKSTSSRHRVCCCFVFLSKFPFLDSQSKGSVIVTGMKSEYLLVDCQ